MMGARMKTISMRFFAKFGGATLDVARELASVAVAQDRNVEQVERVLRGAVDLARQQNCSGASAEERAAVGGELLERREQAFLLHYLQMRGALASRENYAGEAGEVLRLADVGVRGAEAIERRGVGLVVSLDGDDSDFHALDQCKFKGKERTPT